MSEVTIVIPVFNRAAYLPRLFGSLRELHHPSVSLILVDNGSTDNSLAMCREFASSAPFPVQTVQETKRGANAARNRGLSLCHTEWIYFFDSDDELSHDFLDKILPVANDADVVFFPTVQQVAHRRMTRKYVVSDCVAAQILSAMFNTQSLLWRTDYLRQIGGWDESLSIWQDWELGVRLLAHHPRISWRTEESFHCIYVHDDSITGNSYTHNLEGRLYTMRAALADVGEDNSAQRSIFLRIKIMEGMLCREGKHVALWHQMSSTRCPFAIRLLGALLRRYVALGGKGAWRIALQACSC